MCAPNAKVKGRRAWHVRSDARGVGVPLNEMLGWGTKARWIDLLVLEGLLLAGSVKNNLHQTLCFWTQFVPAEFR